MHWRDQSRDAAPKLRGDGPIRRDLSLLRGQAMRRRVLLALAVLALGCATAPAQAAEKTNVGDTCSGEANAFDWDGGFQCVSNAYQRAPLYVGSSSATCATGVAGMIQWTGTAVSPNNTLQYCNGTAWTGVAGSSSSLGASATANSPSRSGDVSTGLFSATASTVSIATAGVEALRVTATGSVGIGTTSPATTLQVNGTATISGTSSTLASVLTNAAEPATVSATAATGTINFYFASQSVLYYTTAASANWTVNFALSAGTTMNSALAVGQAVTAAFLVMQGATAYYNSAVQIDGTTTGVTTYWQGGTAPTAGHASGIDVYQYTIIKTAGTPTYTVLATQIQY